jgi:hypothetical protein
VFARAYRAFSYIEFIASYTAKQAPDHYFLGGFSLIYSSTSAVTTSFPSSFVTITGTLTFPGYLSSLKKVSGSISLVAVSVPVAFWRRNLLACLAESSANDSEALLPPHNPLAILKYDNRRDQNIGAASLVKKRNTNTFSMGRLTLFTYWQFPLNYNRQSHAEFQCDCCSFSDEAS